MATIIILRTTRDDYDAARVSKRSLTVGELIRLLQDFDEKTPIIFSNDVNGYTYGEIHEETVEEINI